MIKPVRVALIGAGAIGQAYGQAAQDLPGTEISFVGDVRPELADQLSASLGSVAAHDIRSLASPQQIDLALVCTPPKTHEELCTMFLEAGVPVMCEKPLATDTAAARRILGVAARTGTALTMASKFRFVSDVTEARSIIQSGQLGKVVRVEVAFASRVDMSQRWNSDPEISGGGVLMDNGTHAVDIVRYILGPIDRVLAATESSGAGLRVEDTAAMLLRTRDGQIGSVDLSWSLDRMTDRYLAAFGTQGSINVGWRESQLRLTASGADVPFGRGYGKISALAENLRNVTSAIRGTEEFVVTPADAIASVAVIEAAYNSVESGQWENVQSRQMERLSA